MTAAMLVLEPTFEADLIPELYACWKIHGGTLVEAAWSRPWRIKKAVALRVNSARTRAAHDIFDVAAADADIAQLMIRELRQFAHRVS